MTNEIDIPGSEPVVVTTSDGLKLRGVRVMPPQGRPKAIVVLAHGYGEHIGRYTHVIAAMTAARYGVYAVDHRGYGRSDGPRAIVDRLNEVLVAVVQSAELRSQFSTSISGAAAVTCEHEGKMARSTIATILIRNASPEAPVPSPEWKSSASKPRSAPWRRAAAMAAGEFSAAATSRAPRTG